MRRGKLRVFQACLNFFLCAALFSCSGGQIAAEDIYDLVISKSSRELKVMDGERLIKRFRITHGSANRGAKRVQGDKKTPEGAYRIVNFKDDSKFHYFMQLDYPNLLDAWYGYKDEFIDSLEFKRIVQAFRNDKIPPQNTQLGGYIGIHGLGNATREKLEIHETTNWTQGCIAMTNEEINDLKQYVRIGTRVIINE